MVKTAPYDIMMGSLLWTIFLSIPLMSIFFKSAELKLLILTLVNPVAISYLSRTGRFWVSKGVVAMAGIAAFIFGSILVRSSNKINQAIADPETNKSAAATSLSFVMLVFLLTMVLSSYFIEPMYNPVNFS
jgi:membrane-bound ClpP family serine protease